MSSSICQHHAKCWIYHHIKSSPQYRRQHALSPVSHCPGGSMWGSGSGTGVTAPKRSLEYLLDDWKRDFFLLGEKQDTCRKGYCSSHSTTKSRVSLKDGRQRREWERTWAHGDITDSWTKPYLKFILPLPVIQTNKFPWFFILAWEFLLLFLAIKSILTNPGRYYLVAVWS